MTNAVDVDYTGPSGSEHRCSPCMVVSKGEIGVLGKGADNQFHEGQPGIEQQGCARVQSHARWEDRCHIGRGLLEDGGSSLMVGLG